jgi:hypothetical protein
VAAAAAAVAVAVAAREQWLWALSWSGAEELTDAEQPPRAVSPTR